MSAIQCIEYILERTNKKKTISSVLDFACGYGRVLRFPKVRFPQTKIAAAEIDSETLNFL